MTFFSIRCNNMLRALFISSSLLIFMSIIGCSGSANYRGNWKAMDMKGNKWDMVFDENRFTISNNKGIVETYDYIQTSIKIENAVKSFGIKLKDGRGFIITFPLPKNNAKGIINHESTSEALYTIGRSDYVSFQELMKL